MLKNVKKNKEETMDKVKLKIFLNLKNFYELSYEIKKEKEHSSKTLMQTVARGIYKELNILFRTYGITFREVNKLFDNVKSLKEVQQVKLT
tara:strand:+ start:763 stop:1035 length:273 start_codon:yes stop_codon:yes gene_type:complete